MQGRLTLQSVYEPVGGLDEQDKELRMTLQSFNKRR
jgi:hypothetical protein